MFPPSARERLVRNSGMPRAAIAAGFVDDVVALDDLPARIRGAAGWKA
jgi:chemotaxis response regulator CheB